MGVIMHNNISYGGGSTIEPNPQESATEQLETLGIDGDVYEVTDANAIHTSDVGVANGIAELDANGKVPKAELPSDVVYDNPTFTEASTRANIASGETIATIFGKIKKWFSDLKDLAFIGKDGTSSTKYLRGDGTWQNFPTIPTVNDGTLTIKQNNTNLGTFTANQSTASNINIECAVPSDVEGSKVATGNPITVTDAAGIKAEKIEIGFEPKQAGSGTPSPSNIRPITGYTSLSADRCGKNLFDINSLIVGGIDNVGKDYQDGNPSYRRTPFIFVKAGKYTIKRTGNTDKWWKGYFYNDADQYAGTGWVFNTYEDSTNTFTVQSDCWIRIAFDYAPSSSDNIQLEDGEIATTYEPYNGSNVTVQFNQTLYGGKLTIFQDGSADVYCDTAYYKFVGNETWSIASSGNCRCERFTDMVQDSNGVCSHLPTGGANGDAYFGDGVFIIVNGRDTYNLNSTNAVQAFTTNMEIAYKLATPFTLHLSPVETLNLLQGINNVWTDGITLSITYQPDNAIGQAKGTAQELVDSASTWKLFAESANANIPLPTNCKELYICVVYVTGSTSAIMYNFHILPDILTKATSYFRQGDYYTPDYFCRCEIRIRKTSSVYDTRVEALYMNNTTDRSANTKVKVYYR